MSEPSGAWSNDKLGSTKELMEAFLADPERLKLAETLLKDPGTSE